jgi:hypothetical protein
MIKHNCISLITHSRTVADIAVILARQHKADIETQKVAWQLGFAHDCGWLNLQSLEKPLHSDATIESLRGIKLVAEQQVGQLIELSVDEEVLVEFARLHADYHFDRNKDRSRMEKFLQENGYDANLVRWVIEADTLATALEKPGSRVKRPAIIYYFTTSLIRDVPNHHLNLIRKHAHVEVLTEFYNSLQQVTSEISESLKLPFTTLISANLRGIEYTLDLETNRNLWKTFGKILRNMIGQSIKLIRDSLSKNVYDHQNINNALLGKPYSGENICVFCNSPSKYIKNLDKIYPIFGRGRITPSFWTNRIQGSERTHGVCPSCLYALSRKLIPFTRKPAIAVAKPRIDAVVVRRERLLKLIRQWRELADKGFCKPNAALWNRQLWMKESPYFTKYYEDIDSRREASDYVKELYDATVKKLRGEIGEDKIKDFGLIAKVDGELSVIADSLMDTKYPLILVDSLKVVDDINIAVIRSTPLQREEGLIAMGILGVIRGSQDATQLLQASLTASDFMAMLEASNISQKVKRKIRAQAMKDFEMFEKIYESIRESVL